MPQPIFFKYIKVNIFVLFLLVIWSNLVYSNSIPFEAKRDMEYACYYSAKQVEFEDYEKGQRQEYLKTMEKYCACENDAYLKVLTPQDWDKYTKDYSLFNQMVQQVLPEFKKDKRSPYEIQIYTATNVCKKDGDSSPVYQRNNPLENIFELIEEALIRGDFESVDKSNFKNQYLVSFLGGYSLFCEAELGPHFIKTYTTETWEETEFSRWKTSETNYTIKIEKKFDPFYQRASDVVQNQMVTNTLTNIFRDARNREISIKPYTTEIEKALFTEKYARDLLSGQCSTPKVKSIHENLYRYFSGLEPVVPKALVKELNSSHLLIEEKAQKRRKLIEEYTKESTKRGIARFQAYKRKVKESPKTQLTCSNRQNKQLHLHAMYENYKYGDYVTANYKGIDGFWDMDLGGVNYEILVVALGRRKDNFRGYAYQKEHDCLFNVYGHKKNNSTPFPDGRSYSAPMDELRFEAVNPIARNIGRVGNCAAAVLDYDKVRPRDYKLNFLFKSETNFISSQLDLFPKLVQAGALTTLSEKVLTCDPRDTVKMDRKGTATPEFKKAIKARGDMDIPKERVYKAFHDYTEVNLN